MLKELIEMYAYIAIVGIVVLTGVVANVMVNVIGAGERPILSAVIGSAVGIIVLLIKPTLLILAVILAVVATVAASIIFNKVG